ncbi:MAG: (2Fe-2S)-binding protein [Hyphomicrobiales bacterium]
MIVCSCNVLSDREVRTAVSSSAPRTTGQVYGCLGCSAQCGRCARTIRKIMDEALGAVPEIATACPTACGCCPKNQAQV